MCDMESVVREPWHSGESLAQNPSQLVAKHLDADDEISQNTEGMVLSDEFHAPFSFRQRQDTSASKQAANRQQISLH